MTFFNGNSISIMKDNNKAATTSLVDDRRKNKHKQNNPKEEIYYKDVVIIGNGPSGISLSYMLDGNLPYYNGLSHPDEMLTARLTSMTQTKTLAEQDLRHLSMGLEGRSQNPVSLLIDAMEHPYADLGFELPALIEWKKYDLLSNEQKLHSKKVDHVVLGKGPPGGSWHTMDPHILTLSLGSWMALPGLPFPGRDNRASAGQVAKYYSEYVKYQHLDKYFHQNTIVTKVEQIYKCCKRKRSAKNIEMCYRTIDNQCIPVGNKCSANNVTCSCFDTTELCHCFDKNLTPVVCCCDESTSKKKICCECYNNKFRSYKYCVDNSDIPITDQQKLENKCLVLVNASDQTQQFTCDMKNYLSCSKICSDNRTNVEYVLIDKDCNVPVNLKRESPVKSNMNANNPFYVEFGSRKSNSVPSNELKKTNGGGMHTRSSTKMKNGYDVEIECECSSKWRVEGRELSTGRKFVYFTKNVVLATGSSDMPNKLGIHEEDENKDWITHNVKDFEDALDQMSDEERQKADPVLIIGAGLSAADAIISARFRSHSVLHVFRRKKVSIDKQLPENMYPEYHKVHQMMSDGGSTYPLYTSLPEHNLIKIDPESRKVTLVNSKTGTFHVHRVSHISILIGSRPDLNFLPLNLNIASDKSLPIDCKTNPIDINPYTHAVADIEGLFALGPLAGDNFVRFIPGGAMAITSSMIKKQMFNSEKCIIKTKNSVCNNIDISSSILSRDTECII